MPTEHALCPNEEHAQRLISLAALEGVEAVLRSIESTPEEQEVATNIADALAELAKMTDPILAIKQIGHIMDWTKHMVPVWDTSSTMETPDELLAFQKNNLSETYKLASATEGEGIAQRVEDRTYQLESWHLLKEAHPDWRLVKSNVEHAVKLLAGGEGRLKSMRYCGPCCPSHNGESVSGRRKSKRGEAGSHSFPGLERLGIEEDITPGIADVVTREVVEGPSVEAARVRLKGRNITMGLGAIHRIYSEFALDCVALRLDWARTGIPPKGLDIEQGDGPILLVASDGFMFQIFREKPGRIPDGYERHPKHQKFTEDKSFTIREIDSEGNMKDLGVIDGTLGNPDDMFTLLSMYLLESGLDLDRYKGIVFGSDGADWMRERIDMLADMLPVPAERIRKFVDWGHGLGHLWDIAKERKGWTGREGARWPRLSRKEKPEKKRGEKKNRTRGGKKRVSPWEWKKQKNKRRKKKKLSKTDRLRRAWFEKAADYLWVGDMETVLAMIDELRVGSKAKEFNKLKGYFVKNRDRMSYQELWDLGLPVGTGAIESAGRQTIGLRLKAGGTAFLPEIAEGMVMCRSYLKRGHWNKLVSMVINFRARRFDPSHPSCNLTFKQVRDRVSVKIPMHDKDKTKRSSGLYEAQKMRLWRSPKSPAPQAPVQSVTLIGSRSPPVEVLS